MSLKFLFGTVLCLVLVVISTVVSLRDYQSRIDEYNTAIAEFNEKARNPSDQKILRKPEVLSIFVHGFEKRFGNVVSMSWSGEIPVRAGGFMGTSESAQFSAEFASIDLVFVIKVVLSLLAIFIAYDAISGEYERGTLKLTLSRPVPRTSIILGKLIAGMGCLLIPLIISFIIGILIIQLLGGINFSSEDWLRIALIAIFGILFITSFYMIGLVVSGRTHRASTSLLILLLIWIIGVFLIPAISTAAVDRYRLMSSNPNIKIAEINRDFSKRMNEDPRPDYINDREAYSKYMVKWNELEDEKNRSVWSIQRQYLNRLYSQADVVRWICRLSPSESFVYLSQAMARTGVESYRNFMRHVRIHHEGHREISKMLWKDREKYYQERDKYIKPAEFAPLDFSASFKLSLPDIILLIISNVLFLILSIMFFNRYDVH
jgi:ABC-type transport system involved in multi-copper enzyme maturation permease subunit